MPHPPAPITHRKLRLALAGCGRVAHAHFQALRELGERAELVDVCDVEPRALRVAAAETGARPHASYEAMLASTDAELVVLATPSGLHADQTQQAAAQGLHVVTEKPMATSLADAERMVRACEAAEVRLFVVKQLRFSPALQRLKRAIDAGRFGRIFLVNVNVLWTRPQSYYDSAAWRGTRALDGGALMNQASHYVDLLDWLFGPVESLQAYTATLARQIEVEDTAVLSLRWRSGTLGSMNVTMLTYPRNWEASLSVVGEHGSVRIGGPAADQIQHWDFATPDVDEPAPDISSAAPPANRAPWSAHARYYDNVLNVLGGEAAPETDGHAGLRSLALLDAAHRSARGGRRVEPAGPDRPSSKHCVTESPRA